LRFGDLVPSIVVAGAVVATIQSEGGCAKSGNNQTSHKVKLSAVDGAGHLMTEKSKIARVGKASRFVAFV
jgi:hypothetical protein